MKPWTITFFGISGLIAGWCGAAMYWNVSGGCMSPAPLTGIGTGIIWCIGVWSVGIVYMTVKEAVDMGCRVYQEAKVRAQEEKSPARELLRPSSPDEANPNILLRPAMSRPNSPPKELLRAGEKPEERS